MQSGKEPRVIPEQVGLKVGIKTQGEMDISELISDWLSLNLSETFKKSYVLALGSHLSMKLPGDGLLPWRHKVNKPCQFM